MREFINISMAIVFLIRLTLITSPPIARYNIIANGIFDTLFFKNVQSNVIFIIVQTNTRN